MLNPSNSLQIDGTVDLPLSRSVTTVASLVTFSGMTKQADHFALALGDRTIAHPLVRLHSECVTGDVFVSLRCDCGAQRDEAIERISATGGYVLYLRQEGRGIGLTAKARAYALQDTGLDTYAANTALGLGEDQRDYTIAIAMLRALGVERLTLLSNNPAKSSALRDAGLDVAITPTGTHATAHNGRYLRAKRRHGHTL